MKKNILLLLLLLGFILLWSTEVQDVLASADKGFSTFFTAVQKKSYEKYGFDRGDIVSDFTFGTPFQILAIDPGKIQQEKSENDLFSLTENSELWYVPVVKKENVCCLLLIDKINDDFEAVSMGYRPLAVTIFKYLQESDSCINETNIYIVRQTGTIYIQLSGKNDIVTEIKSDVIARGEYRTDSASQYETIEKLERQFSQTKQSKR